MGLNNVLSRQILREQPLATSRERGYFSSRLHSVSTPASEFLWTRSFRTVCISEKNIFINQKQCVAANDQSRGN